MENKPCISPFTFKLEDCLACSSCITDFDMKKVPTYLDLKDEELTFLISPHSKLSMYSHYKNNLYFHKKDTVSNSKKDTSPNSKKDSSPNSKKDSSPNSKKDTVSNSKKDTFKFFEYKLAEFIKVKFNCKKVYDTSYIKNILFDRVYNQPGKVIISDCPGTVSYIERQAFHLLPYLSNTKSQQQALLKGKTLSIVQCYDKMIENPHLSMTTYDFYKMIIEEGFYEFDCEGQCEEWEKCRISNHYGYLEYILKRKYLHLIDFSKEDGTKEDSNKKDSTKESFNNVDFNKESFNNVDYNKEDFNNVYCKLPLQINGKRRLNLDSFTINKINIPGLEYESRNGVFIYKMKEGGVTKKYIRILGLEPFLNFIKETKIKMDYEVCEIYICNQGCINGPGQLYTDENNIFYNNLQDDDQEFNLDIEEDLDLEDRVFTKQKTKKVNFKVEW